MNFVLPAVLDGTSRKSSLGQEHTEPGPGRTRLPSAPQPPLRVIAVDDHFAVRAALVDTINAQADMAMVGVAASSDEAIALVQRERPTVAIVDINLGEESGLELVERLREVAPGLHCIVFSIFDEPFYARRARQAGASGYVSKSESTERVVGAIRAVAGGEDFFRRRPQRKEGRSRESESSIDDGEALSD